MNKECGLLIGNTIRKSIEVDLPDDGLGWVRYLRIKVELCLAKVIARALTVKVKGNRVWIPLQYEKLPNICLKCGRIVHALNECANDAGKSTMEEELKPQFGS